MPRRRNRPGSGRSPFLKLFDLACRGGWRISQKVEFDDAGLNRKSWPSHLFCPWFSLRDIRMKSSRRGLFGLGAMMAFWGSARADDRSDTLAFALPTPSVPIVGSAQSFPIRRIYCIGRNYAEHAVESGSDPRSEPPFFFQKPSDAAQFVAPGTIGDHPLSDAHRKLPARDRASRLFEIRRPRYSCERSARPYLWLWHRPRHDAARPAACHGRPEEALGNRQKLRPFGAPWGRCIRWPWSGI